MLRIATLFHRTFDQRGSSLLEVLVAAAILGAIGFGFINAISTGQMGAHRVEAMSAAESTARKQIELLKSLPYNDDNYYPVIEPYQDRYSVGLEVLDLSPPEDPNTLQKIIVKVSENERILLSVETLKVKR